MIDKILSGIFGRLWDAFSEHPHDALAFAGIPAIVVFFIVSEIGAPWAFAGGQQLTAVQFESQIPSDTQTSVSDGGLVMLLEADAEDFRIEWSEGSAASLLLSLDSEYTEINKRRFILDPSGFELQGPLLGLKTPVAIYAGGVTAHEVVGTGGRRMPLSELEPYSRFSLSMALSGLLAVLFGCGLSTASLLQREVADEARGGESHKKD